MRAVESNERFDRYECKYLLSETDAEQVEFWLQPHLQPDPFAERRGGRYGDLQPVPRHARPQALPGDGRGPAQPRQAAHPRLQR
jgi:hypothetical protein